MTTEENLLIPSAQYLKSGIHIGTKFKTGYMKEFIYKTRPDGLSVLNLQKTDERIKECGKILAKYEPDEILILSRRENGWLPVKMLSKFTGIKVIAGRYPPGMLTNPELEIFAEPKIIMVTDPWPDRNVIKDAMRSNIPSIALCDTNNETNNLHFFIPCNNKGKKSLGLLFWLLTNEYLRNRGDLRTEQTIEATAEDFTEK